MEISNIQQFFDEVLNKKVRVKLWTGMDLEGKFVSIDEQFNVVLNEGEKLITDKKEAFKDVFIRGNNIRLLEACD